MIGLIPRDDFEALGLTVELEIVAGDLEGALIGLRAARGIEDAGQMRWGHVDELFGQFNRRQIRKAEKARRKGELADLLAHYIADLRAAMADVDIPETRQAIDELLPLQILNIDAMPLDQDFRPLVVMGLQCRGGVQDICQIIAIPVMRYGLHVSAHRCPSPTNCHPWRPVRRPQRSPPPTIAQLPEGVNRFPSGGREGRENCSDIPSLSPEARMRYNHCPLFSAAWAEAVTTGP